MKVFNYVEFLKESEHLHLSPQSYVESALKNLESKIKKMFDYSPGQVDKFDDIKMKSRRDKGELSFIDLGLSLQSLELSKYSKVYDNLKLKFSDDEFLYDITFTINLEDAIPKDKKKDFNDSNIKNCQVIFKKYDIDNFDLLLGPKTKTCKISEIDEEYLVKLKVEFEEGSIDDDFKIERSS